MADLNELLSDSDNYDDGIEGEEGEVLEAYGAEARPSGRSGRGSGSEHNSAGRRADLRHTLRPPDLRTRSKDERNGLERRRAPPPVDSALKTQRGPRAPAAAHGRGATRDGGLVTRAHPTEVTNIAFSDSPSRILLVSFGTHRLRMDPPMAKDKLHRFMRTCGAIDVLADVGRDGSQEAQFVCAYQAMGSAIDAMRDLHMKPFCGDALTLQYVTATLPLVAAPVRPRHNGPPGPDPDRQTPVGHRRGAYDGARGHPDDQPANRAPPPYSSHRSPQSLRGAHPLDRVPPSPPRHPIPYGAEPPQYPSHSRLPSTLGAAAPSVVLTLPDLLALTQGGLNLNLQSQLQSLLQPQPQVLHALTRGAMQDPRHPLAPPQRHQSPPRGGRPRGRQSSRSRSPPPPAGRFGDRDTHRDRNRDPGRSRDGDGGRQREREHERGRNMRERNHGLGLRQAPDFLGVHSRPDHRRPSPPARERGGRDMPLRPAPARSARPRSHDPLESARLPMSPTRAQWQHRPSSGDAPMDREYQRASNKRGPPTGDVRGPRAMSIGESSGQRRQDGDGGSSGWAKDGDRARSGGDRQRARDDEDRHRGDGNREEELVRRDFKRPRNGDGEPPGMRRTNGGGEHPHRRDGPERDFATPPAHRRKHLAGGGGDDEPMEVDTPGAPVYRYEDLAVVEGVEQGIEGGAEQSLEEVAGEVVWGLVEECLQLSDGKGLAERVEQSWPHPQGEADGASSRSSSDAVEHSREGSDESSSQFGSDAGEQWEDGPCGDAMDASAESVGETGHGNLAEAAEQSRGSPEDAVDGASRQCGSDAGDRLGDESDAFGGQFGSDAGQQLGDGPVGGGMGMSSKSSGESGYRPPHGELDEESSGEDRCRQPHEELDEGSMEGSIEVSPEETVEALANFVDKQALGESVGEAANDQAAELGTLAAGQQCELSSEVPSEISSASEVLSRTSDEDPDEGIEL